ncbi:hypothetical protein PF005_g9499 [Phytophthora fragariae]|nr:hypothetical protein PF009_g10108 [Phytophthora fragariae]KAE9013617.1 hypothetical protein PF011_g8408 [Phytophthora fragariae]KAE9117655.1 hypothetical protein PF010_g8531 [Phytophthora fragariae]KAE9146448.1 hypothetical protein PF006_g8800 [Phytophthora fragariae]KAE9215307.1 hypothetical protein PF005_g9499 [Phytophthora fragariae]
MDTAAKNGHLEVLQWLDANHLFRCTKPAMVLAAENGHLEVVKWLHQVHHECCSSGALRRAANSGDLVELVEWIYANVHMNCHHTDPYMYLDTTIAASRGCLDVLKWTHEHFPGSFRSDAMDAAASNGHMDVITWLFENRREGCTASAAFGAARNGHMDVLKWLYTHYPKTFVVDFSDVINRAAGNGHLEVVRWLHETRPDRVSTHALHFAAAEGHLDTFLYLLDHLNEGSSGDVHRDARGIKLLYHFNLDDSGDRRCNRATGDQLKMLQAIFEQRPAFVRDWLQYLVHLACSKGNVAILDWVSQFGIELNSTKPIRDAASRGDVKMLQWFLENGFEFTDPNLLRKAVLTGQLEAVHWLTKHGHDVNSVKLTTVGYNMPILRWLAENGPPIDLSTATKLVLEKHHVEIAWWVSEDNRRHLVLEALHKNDRKVAWWILAHTQFQDESALRSIRDAIRCCPKDTQKWLKKSLSEVEACRWYFAMATKRPNEESGETGLPSTRRRRHA